MREMRVDLKKCENVGRVWCLLHLMSLCFHFCIIVSGTFSLLGSGREQLACKSSIARETFVFPLQQVHSTYSI
jgi:hypothetical protein